MLLAAAAGCSAPSLTGNPKNTGLSEATVNTLVFQFAQALGNGMASARLLSPTPNHGQRDNGPAGPSHTQVSAQVSHRTDCAIGGHIDVNGGLTGTLDDTGTGALSLQVTETINGWQCATGYTVDGAPHLSAAGTISVLNGQQSSAATVSFGGLFTWTGNGSGTCNVELTM
ncbi:MAG: hypothetical protein KGO03_07080, partial [Gemmatimonadota bacterium]|nr:hypothetical protein [Gemmatimonadota bacterium]